MSLIINAAQCLKCGEIIESYHRHDFKQCQCGNIAVDGGKDYARRCFMSQEWVELSTYDEPQTPVEKDDE